MVRLSDANSESVHAETYSSSAAKASRMSSSRCVQLRGINRLSEDALAELALQRAAGDEVDGVAQQIREVVSDILEAEQADRAVELDEEVDVAVLGGFVSGDGAEERERADAHGAKLGPVGGQNVEGLSASEAHRGCIVHVAGLGPPGTPVISAPRTRTHSDRAGTLLAGGQPARQVRPA